MIKNFLKNWRKELLWLLVILLLAAGLRIVRILVYQQPVFADEAIYIRWSQIMQNEATLRFLPLSDGKQPLFMWSIIPFLKFISDPLVAGRMLSVVTGMGTLVGVFVLTWVLFNSKRASLFAAFLYSISPFAIFFDSLALVDSMLSMFGVWIFVFSVLTVKHLRLDFAMITGMLLGGAFLTKSPAIFFALLVPASLIFLKMPNGKGVKIDLILRLLFLFLVTYTLAFGIYNILRLGPNFHMVGARNQDYIFPISHIWENPKDPFVFHVKEIIEWLWLLGPSVLLLLIFSGVILRFNKYKKEVILVMLWIMVPLFINAMYAKVFTARYILSVVPLLYVVSGISFMKSIKNKFWLTLIGIFVIHSLFVDYQLINNIQKTPLPKNERSGYLEEWTSGYGIKDISEYLKNYQIENPNKKIVVGTEGYFGTLPDGLQMYLADFPQITIIGVGLDLNEVPTSLIESREFGNATFLVINDSRLRADPNKLGLKTVASYPKALRRVGTREYNTLGPKETLYLYEVTDKSF